MIINYEQEIDKIPLRNDELYSYNFADLGDSASINTCIFCGNTNGNIDFKGRCVCEECLSFVKDLM